MNEKKRNAILAAVASVSTAVCGATAISYAVTRMMLSFAIDRKDPPQFEKRRDAMAGSGKLRQIFAEQRENSEKLASLPHETVEIEGFDGVRLIGHYFRVDDAKRTVVAFHGWRSAWSRDFSMIYDFWFKNGCNVLFVEQRGQKGSSGEYMGFGLLERFDCQGWVNYLTARNDTVTPLYLAGVSMGAATVLMASGLNLPDCVHGILADCGFTSPYAIWKYVSEKNLHLPFTGFRAKVASDICRRKLNNSDSRYSAEDALRFCRVPVLFAHGAADKFVPVTMTYQNYLACASEKRLLIVPGADHGMSYLVERERYEKEVLDFFAYCDGRAPAPAPLPEETPEENPPAVEPIKTKPGKRAKGKKKKAPYDAKQTDEA
ncbi:MAG: alpha/beta hydrolase [Clostridia bacterium]|nr:alpha/beta hydrolase [Clostridia bacterium]